MSETTEVRVLCALLVFKFAWFLLYMGMYLARFYEDTENQEAKGRLETFAVH